MAAIKKQTVKKAATPKKQEKVEAPAWNTIHVFGYGETQVIGKGANGKVPNENLKNIEPLITYLEGIQGKGTRVSMETLHALNIYNNNFIDFLPKSGKNKYQRFAWTDLDTKQITKLMSKLSDEISGKILGKEASEKRNEAFRAQIPSPLKNKLSARHIDKKKSSVSKTSLKKNKN